MIKIGGRKKRITNFRKILSKRKFSIWIFMGKEELEKQLCLKCLPKQRNV